MRVLVLAGALLAAACLTLSAGAGIRANSQTFSDSTGEDAAAPDVTSVVVSNDDSGTLTFQVNISNRPALTSDMAVNVFIDTDLNAANGAGPDFLGADIVLALDHGGVDLAKWGGSGFVFSGSPSSLVASYANGATIKVKAADLGLTTFNFYVATQAGTDPDFHVDFAPDSGHGVFNYQIKITPPAATPPTTPKAKSKPKAKPPLCKKGQKSTIKKPCRKK